MTGFEAWWPLFVRHELTHVSVLLSSLVQRYNNPTYDPKSTEVLDPSSKNIKLWIKAHFPFLEIS